MNEITQSPDKDAPEYKTSAQPWRKEWSAGWKIVLASMAGIGLGLSPLPFYTLAVLSQPMMAEFGWNLGEVFFALTFMTFGVLAGAPVAGYLTDKYGARRVALASLVFLSAGMFSFSFLSGSLTQFYVQFFIMSVLASGTLPITWTRAINNNFHSHRGLALGVALMGTGLFGFVGPSFTQYMVDSYDWRMAYRVLSLLPLLIALPLGFIFFKDPYEQSALQGKTVMDSSQIPGMKIGDIFRDWRFYVIGFGFLAIGFAVSGLIQTIKYILQAQGYSPQMAAGLFTGLGLVGLSVVFGRMIGGYLIDRFWAPGVAFVLLILPAVSCLIFSLSGMPIWANSLAIIFIGFAAGVEYDMMAFLVSRYFGMKSYGRAYGLLYASFGVGAGIAPGYFGKALSEGGQTGVLILAASLVSLGALSLLTIGKYRQFDAEGQRL